MYSLVLVMYLNNISMLNQILIGYLAIVFMLNYSEAARILCFQPVPFDSHQTVLHTLTEELARQGHQLVVLTALPRKEPMENISDIDVHELSYSRWEKGYDIATKYRNTYAFPDSLVFWNMVGEIMNPLFDLQLSHPQMQALIKDESQRFDLIIVEACAPIGSMFRARFQAPVLLVSSMTTSAEAFSLVGAVTNNLFYPDYTATSPIYNLSFWQKLYFLYSLARNKLTDCEIETTQDAFIKSHFGAQAPPMGELKKDVGMLFVNVYHFWDNNRPSPIGTALYMGGLHLQPPKSLPQDFKAFMDNSKHGVVIMILGSKLKSSALPARTVRVIIDVFSELPYDFIWKWETDEMPNKPNNVRLEKWLPQNDLLHHPKLRALITHGGMQSTDEAISAGVPLVGLPVFVDQWLNTHQYEKFGIGIRLDIDFLDKEDFKNAVLAVVEDKKYRENVRRLSRIASDRRESALRTSSRWAGLLATRGARHLMRSALADATFVQFFMLDLMLIAVICFLVVIVVLVFAVKRMTKFLVIRMGGPITLRK